MLSSHENGTFVHKELGHGSIQQARTGRKGLLKILCIHHSIDGGTPEMTGPGNALPLKDSGERRRRPPRPDGLEIK